MADGPKIKLGALPTVSATIIPAAVEKYLATNIKNPIKVVTGENHILLEQLRESELDLVVGRLPAPENMQGLSFEPLYRDKVVFVVHNTHPLANSRNFQVETLDNYTVLLPSNGSIIRPFVDRLFVEHGISEIDRPVETVSDSFGRAFLRKYDAVWIISRGVVARELADGEFVVLPIDTSSTFGAVGLMVRANSPLNPAASYFSQILRTVIEDLPPQT